MRAPKTDAAWFPWLLLGLVMEWASWVWGNSEVAPQGGVAGGGAGGEDGGGVVPEDVRLDGAAQGELVGGDVVHLDVVVGEHGQDVAVEGAVEHLLARDNHHDLA